MLHFEDLWEKCESLHKNNCEEENIDSIIKELQIKIELYRTLLSKKDLIGEELPHLKSRTMGEILLTLTNLSLRENINVYDSLVSALRFREIEIYSTQNQE